MTWKNEAITSACGAEDFLRRQFTALNIPDLKIVSNRHHGLSFWAGTDVCGNLSCLMNLQIMTTENNVTLQTVWLADKMRGTGFGLMAAKSAIGIAYRHTKTAVCFYSVRCHGISFWPSLGALPLKRPCGISGYITHALDQYGAEIDAPSTQKIKEIASLGKNDPFKAWRDLSQTDTRLNDGTFFKHLAFEPICRGRDLFLSLDQEETREILTRRLGNIPAFRAVGSGAQRFHRPFKKNGEDLVS